jgi:hypothetical protein
VLFEGPGARRRTPWRRERPLSPFGSSK